MIELRGDEYFMRKALRMANRRWRPTKFPSERLSSEKAKSLRALIFLTIYIVQNEKW